jgi:hypothetical protein
MFPEIPKSVVYWSIFAASLLSFWAWKLIFWFICNMSVQIKRLG